MKTVKQAQRKSSVGNSRRSKYWSRKTQAMALMLLTALLLSGCQARQTASQPNGQTEAPGPTAITLFGTTVASRQQHLILPCNAVFITWLARDGQKLAPGDPVFRIDRAQWTRHADQQKIRQQAIITNLAVLQDQIDQLSLLVEQKQMASQADLESGLAILEKLVRATSQARRNSYEAELFTFLAVIDGLSLHQNLVSLTRDGAQVKNLARPILTQWVADLQAAADQAMLQAKVLHQQRLTGQAEMAETASQLAILEDWLSGETQQTLGYLDKEGCFIYTGSACLLERGAIQDGNVLQAGQPVAVFTGLPVSTVSVPVDEQLITQVALGATVQLSPLYDRTVVWVGRVTFISEKAVIINGETVIPVLVLTDAVLPGPGYTVIAKILPVVP